MDLHSGPSYRLPFSHRLCRILVSSQSRQSEVHKNLFLRYTAVLLVWWHNPPVVYLPAMISITLPTTGFTCSAARPVPSSSKIGTLAFRFQCKSNICFHNRNNKPLDSLIFVIKEQIGISINAEIPRPEK